MSTASYVKRQGDSYYVGGYSFGSQAEAEIFAYLFKNYDVSTAIDVTAKVTKLLTDAGVIQELGKLGADFATGKIGLKIFKFVCNLGGMAVMAEQAKAGVGNPYSPKSDPDLYVKFIFYTWSHEPYRPIYWAMKY